MHRFSPPFTFTTFSKPCTRASLTAACAERRPLWQMTAMGASVVGNWPPVTASVSRSNGTLTAPSACPCPAGTLSWPSQTRVRSLYANLLPHLVPTRILKRVSLCMVLPLQA